MRIALVHRSSGPRIEGGMARVYQGLGTALSRYGVTVRTVGAVEGSGLYVYEFDRDEWVRRECGRRSYAVAIAQELSSFRPDYAECFSWEPELVDQPMSRYGLCGVRVDVSAYTVGAERSVWEVERKYLAQSQVKLAVSEFAARDAYRAYGIRVPTVCPNGVDRVMFGHTAEEQSCGRVLLDRLGVRADMPLCLWIGKETQMKGWDILRQVVRLLRGRVVFLFVLGHCKGDYRMAPIEGVITASDLGDADLAKLYRSARFVLVTSRWEGFGLSIVEAISCGATVLLPSRLEVGRELGQSGRDYYLYGSLWELERLVQEASPLCPTLDSRFDWGMCAETTLRAVAEVAGV